MIDSILECLAAMKNFLELDIDLNDKENKQYLLSIIENIENEIEEMD